MCSKLTLNKEPLFLFILGFKFTTNENILIQLQKIAGSEFSFEDYLVYLNEYGKDRNSIVFFIIDAINEGNYLNLWKKMVYIN